MVSYERMNRLSLLIIIAVNLLIISLVAQPALSFWWQSHFGNKQTELLSLMENILGAPSDSIPDSNRLIIPALFLDEEIFEGTHRRTLRQGVWRRPASSTPAAGSNTVLVGHRTAFSRSPVFYHLDKLSLGDKLAVFWQGKKYVYEVRKIHEVSARAIEIEKPSETSRLTLYTCTPLGTAQRRLVVVAEELQP